MVISTFLHLQPGLCLMEPWIPQAAAGRFGVCSLLQAGCVGRERTGSKEAMSKEKGKRGRILVSC